MRITAIVCAVSAALAAVTVSAGVASAAPQQTDYVAPYVDLSPDAPNVIHNANGTLTVRITATPRSPKDIICQGTFFAPSIVSLGTKGTAVHYGLKYFCTSPVSYDITSTIEDWYEETQDGPLVGHLGGSVSASGVAMQPTAQGNSYTCVNNQNSGWQPFGNGYVNGTPDSKNGNVVTVGCRVN
jgi:hypothetical protein